MDDYKVALFLHLVGVLLFVAGIVLASVAFEIARRQKSPAEIALLLAYGAGWVDDSIALYVVALVLGAFGGQRPKQARRLAVRLHAEHIAVTEALHDLLDDRLSRVANYASLLAILAVLVLMVFKP